MSHFLNRALGGTITINGDLKITLVSTRRTGAKFKIEGDMQKYHVVREQELDACLCAHSPDHCPKHKSPRG